MWIALLFIGISYLFALIAGLSRFRMRGTFKSFIFAILALGFAVIALPFIVSNNYTIHPSISIISSSGNTIISSYNTSTTPSTSIQNLMLGYAEINVIVMFAYVFLMLSYLFTERRKTRYER
jgi:hypothetical protein